MSQFLNELEARNLLFEHGVSMVKSISVTSKAEVQAAASKMQFPIVMKILSADIQHKTEACCVYLKVEKKNTEQVYEQILKNAAVYDANAKLDGVLMQEMAKPGLEVILGMKKDPQFGPVLMVGTGGIYVEVFKDVSLRLLPLTRQEIRRMLRETKLYQIIQGARGMQYDEDALIDNLERVAALVKERPDIEEIDINPLFLYEKGNGAKGVDALIRIAK